MSSRSSFDPSTFSYPPHTVNSHLRMTTSTDETPQLHLPSEIILQIISYVPPDSAYQSTLHCCCLLSRRWNEAATPYLYSSPRLSPHNFFKFTDTICPPLGARRRKTDLGRLVHRLDMRTLQYHSTNSTTARLLGRVKEHLESFHAPPKSFSMNSLAPLSKCHHLRILDLSLLTEHISLPHLSTTFAQLRNVIKLRISRSTSRDIRENCHLPPNLIDLVTNGNPPWSSGPIPSFIWPESLTSLSIIGCEGLSPDAWPEYSRLTHLSLVDCFSNPRTSVLSSIMWNCTNLIFFSAPGKSFDGFFECPAQVTPHPLETIEMSRSMSFLSSFPMKPFSDALHDRLGNLKCLRVHSRLCVDRKFVRDLDEAEELLVERAEARGEKESERGEDEVGVVFFD